MAKRKWRKPTNIHKKTLDTNESKKEETADTKEVAVANKKILPANSNNKKVILVIFDTLNKGKNYIFPEFKDKKTVISLTRFLFILFITLLIGAGIDAVFLSDLKNTIDDWRGKAEIYVNINEIHPLEDGLQEDFSLMFGTRDGTGMLVLVNQMHGGINNIIRDLLIPFAPDFSDNYTQYFISIRNEGNRKVKDLKVTFKGDTLKPITNDLDKKIDYIYFGGYGIQSFCDIRENDLAPKEVVSFFIKAKTPSITDVMCHAKGNYESFTNLRSFYARSIIKNGIIIMNFSNGDKIVELPPLNNTTEMLIYFYKPDENRWVTQ
jgi:hypothetical protein